MGLPGRSLGDEALHFEDGCLQVNLEPVNQQFQTWDYTHCCDLDNSSRDGILQAMALLGGTFFCRTKVLLRPRCRSENSLCEAEKYFVAKNATLASARQVYKGYFVCLHTIQIVTNILLRQRCNFLSQKFDRNRGLRRISLKFTLNFMV